MRKGEGVRTTVAHQSQRDRGFRQHAPARAMTMFNITDGNNNISRDKPVEHIDLVIGLHVSACTSCTRTMRVRRDIAIDITESVQLLVRFNALRSMPAGCPSYVRLLEEAGLRGGAPARPLQDASIDARHAQARALQRRRDARDGSCCIGHTGRCSKCASAAAPRRPM